MNPSLKVGRLVKSPDGADRYVVWSELRRGMAKSSAQHRSRGIHQNEFDARASVIIDKVGPDQVLCQRRLMPSMARSQRNEG